MDNNRDIRWGVIGCGNVMDTKSGPAYQKVAGFRLQAVMSRQLEKAKTYAQSRHIPRYTDISDEIIFADDIDAVYIATPPDSHALYAQQVAKANKPCCIEKPLSHSLAASEQIVELFEAAGVPLFVAYYRRFLPRFVFIKQLLAANRIGAPKQLNWVLSKPPRQDELRGQYRWHTDLNVARGGYFEDIGSHGLNLFEFLLGDISYVSGSVANTLGLYPAADIASARWQHANGVWATGSWCFTGGLRRDQVIITGDQGLLQFSVFDEQPIELTTTAGIQRFDIANPTPVQIGFVEAVRDSLLRAKAHVSDGRSALATDRVVHTILGDYPHQL